jgi:DNA helicase II / ATP-dependent DNA helicase PcrA
VKALTLKISPPVFLCSDSEKSHFFNPVAVLFIMISLNNEQQAAAHAAKGATLVLAGAGSGKTKTLIERVRNTLQSGLCTAENILIMTFSNKAAEEIRERVCEGLSSDGKDITAGTFHSVALQILKKFGDCFLKQFGFSSFPEIMDDDVRQKVLLKLFDSVKDQFLGMPGSVVLSIIMNDKLQKVHGDILKVFSDFKEIYREYKKINALIDFNDIIHYAADLIKKDEDVAREITALYQYLFVDEYQDMSKDLFEFITALTGSDGNIFAVGDDRQSIYGFRGADIIYIHTFKEFFTSCAVYFLSHNYRSNSEIVSLSDIFILSKKKQYKNRSVAPLGNGANIQSFPICNKQSEISMLSSIIEKHEQTSDIVILCRNNWQCDIIHDNLISESSAHNIRCMTVHASKGLEFETVIVAGLRDGIFPDKYTDIEEERRLFYVAITRAKKNLYLLYHVENRIPSRFIAESVLSKMWALHHPVLYFNDRMRFITSQRCSESAILLEDNRYSLY